MNNTFLKVEDSLFEKGLNANDILIFAKIKQYIENGRDCYMSNAQFADWLNISSPTVDASLKKLEKKNLITRKTNVVSNLGKITRQRVIYLKKNSDKDFNEKSNNKSTVNKFTEPKERKFTGYSF